jgi:hypothetical protein
MSTRTRWLAGILAGLGLTAPALADPTPARRFDAAGPDGQRMTVVDVLPTTDISVPPPAGPRVVDVAPAPAAAAEACPELAPACGPKFWAEADYLQWWYRGGSLPPLVTAGSPLDPIPGALAQPGTRVLFGGGRAEPEWVPGGRLRFGGSAGGRFGWEAGGFYTRPQSESGSFDSGGVPVLARPFYDAFAVTPASLLFGAAGAFSGQVTTTTRTAFWGLEANATCALDECGTHTGFVGYRYLQMTDELAIAGRYQVGEGGLAFVNGVSLLPDATGLIGDRVRAHNEFHGAQVGWKYHGGYGRFGLDVRTAVAVGVGSERVDLNGTTQSVDADGTIRTAPAGLLVQASNAGRYGRDLLTVVPEVGVRLTACVMPGVSVHAGYDFLYWASVARAGDQLDHVVDTRQAPFSGSFTGGGPGFRPVSPLRDTAFWANGLNVGVRVEY